MFRKGCAILLLIALFACVSAGAEQVWQVPFQAGGGYTYVAFGRYPFEADGSEKPIVWRYLTTDQSIAYLMSEYILDVSRVHDNAMQYPGWDQALLKAWLNEVFPDKAFNEQEKTALTANGELGRVSLPDAADLQNASLGFGDNEDRMAHGTPWAQANGLYYYRKTHHNPYWTRTQSTKTFAHRSTKESGALGYLGVTAVDMGVRPVIWVDTAKLEVTGGTGTVEDPFVLSPLPVTNP